MKIEVLANGDKILITPIKQLIGGKVIDALTQLEAHPFTLPRYAGKGYNTVTCFNRASKETITEYARDNGISVEEANEKLCCWGRSTHVVPIDKISKDQLPQLFCTRHFFEFVFARSPDFGFYRFESPNSNPHP